jgi:hypothetical protein
VTNEAANHDCNLPIGDDGSLNEGRSSSELIVIKINETLLSWKQQLCQNANTGNQISILLMDEVEVQVRILYG